MRFPIMFSRWKGAGQPASVPILLGGDAVPAPPAETPGALDNVLNHRFSNVNGWPCHRIAVVYDGSKVVAPVSLSATMVLYDRSTRRWYRVGPANVVLNEGVITFFDTLGLIEQVATSGGISEASGSESAMLIVSDPGAAPDGEHVFAMGADLTTIGI